MYLSTRKYCNVFFERRPQFASDLTTEVGDVGSLSRHSGTRSHMLASRKDKGCADSCEIAVHSIPTTASTNMDSVVNGNVQVHVSRQMKVCKMEELDESMVWREAMGLGAIKTFLEAHRERCLIWKRR